MKYSIKVMMALCVVSLLIAGGCQTFSKNWSKEEKEVLELEKQVWESRCTRNYSDYSKLFRNDSIGWSFEESWPTTGILGKTTFEKLPKPPAYDLKPMAIKIFQDFAIMYVRYTIPITYLNSFGQPVYYAYEGRVGRVCIKEGGTWRIIASCDGGSIADDFGIVDPGQNWSKEQKEVLKLEVQYWDALKAGKISDLMKLFHIDFIGWPNFSPKPIGNKEYENMFSNIIPIGSYEYRPMAIKIFSPLAIIYGRYGSTGKDGTMNAGRIGHVCIKQGGTWQIIGGYSGGSTADGK